MDRNRETRRPSIVGSNGFNRSKHRTNTLKDSPDEDGGLELKDTVRLRDRLKKDRDRERERERDLRERSSRSKRRRAEKLTNNIGGDETSEDSVNDEEDDENTSPAAVRSMTPVVNSVPNHHHHHISNPHHSFSQQQHNSNSTSSNITNSTNHHHLQHRKSSPPNSASGKIFRPPPVWKSGEEMISVSVPRKARSASTKRSHDWISSTSNNNSGGGGGEKNLRQVSGSPVRQGLAALSSTPLAAAPTSPSSSSASTRKKLKPIVNHSGPKLKPPKGGSSSKPSSSNPEELEIEIAEVLYGLMTQSQATSSNKEESARDVNRSNNSSPISNSTSTANPISAVASKRKRPRLILEITDQTRNSDISSPRLVKITEEDGCEIGGNSANSQGLALEPPSELVEVNPIAGELRVRKDFMASKEDEVCSPKEKESAAVKAEDRSTTDSPSTATTSVINTTITMVLDVENHEEEKFEIDLMAPPPQVKSSPERELMADSKSETVDQKPVLSVDSVVIKEKEDKDKRGKDHLHLVAEENKCKATGEGVEPHKVIENGGRKINLEKTERDGIAGVNVSGDKLQVQSQKNQMPVKATRGETLTEKPGHSATSLPLPISVATWPGGVPPLGSYVAPLQGVVSMDTSTVTPAPIQPLFSHPRPKRCATHCHIARNIHRLQQFMKMNPFWPAPAGPAALYGSKPCNFSVTPSADVQGNIAVRGVSNVQDMGQSLASNPNNGGKEKGSQLSCSDSAPRKQQIMIQQALSPVAPNNLLGPAFILPLNPQQTAIAALPSALKSSVTGTSANTSSCASTSVSSAGTGAAAAGMSFNYPNVAANETQYLAILQNGAYPFPIPAVGAPPNYQGTPAQPMPLFNGSYFSSQMIHPSQLQHSQPTSNQQWQLLQTQQNASPSNGSLSSHKHVHSQQQRQQSSGLARSSGSANIQNFVGQKTQQPQQLQQSLNQYRQSSRPRQLDSEMDCEDSPSTTDGRGSRASVNICGSNVTMPIYPQNYPLMAPPAVTMSGNSNQNEKKAHQPQRQGAQRGVESLSVQSFAMSFCPINGTTAGSGIDISSMSQNHSMFKNSPEATQQNIQMMAAVAAAAQQQKSFRVSEDGKSGPVDSSVTDDERNSFSGKALSGVGQSITFTRSEVADEPIASVQANSVIESSGRSPSVASVPSRSSRTVTTNAVGAINVPNVHIQQQQLATTAVNLSKVQATSNGSVFSEHFMSSSAMNAKFSNALSGFPQNVVQSNSGNAVQSPQWKTSTRPMTSPAPSSLGSSPGTSQKNLHQQQPRTQSQMQNQISFVGGSQKPSSMSQGLALPSCNNQSPPSMVMVGSPTTSTISKGTGGSPRTASSTINKMGQLSSLSTQQSKNAPTIPSQKSPSIFGNPHITSSSSSNSAKPQIQQQPQQQLSKTIQQAQLFFSSPYAHSQSPHPASTSSTTSSPGGYYMQQRRRADQHQQLPGAPVTSSTGLLSVCPVTLSGMSTNDPAKAIAAATSNMKGGGLPSEGSIMQASQFAVPSMGTILPAGFSYVQPVPAAVPVKTAEQKQPTGRENLHARQS